MLKQAIRTLLLLAALPVCDVGADTIICVDGRVLEGEVQEESATTVRIKTATGSVTLPRGEVKVIEYKESPFQACKSRREKLASDDAKGRWELAEFCLKHRLERDAAALLDELLSMASPYYTQATRKLADLVAGKDPKRAVKLLDGLAEKTDDPEARIRSRDLKRALDEKRKKAYDEALQHLQEKNWNEAIETLRFAYLLSYSGSQAAGGEKLTEEEILAKLAEVRGLYEQTLRARKGGSGNPGEAVAGKAPLACRKCPQGSGWRECLTCQGVGQIERVIPGQFTAAGIIPERKVRAVCPVCSGAKMARCPGCAGAGIDLERVDGRTRMTLKSAADAAWGRPNEDVCRAMKEVADVALRDKLRLPADYVPVAPEQQAWRELLPAVPVGADFEPSAAGKKLQALWKKAARQERGRFLCGYAFEAAQGAAPAIPGAVEEPGKEEPGAAKALDLPALRMAAPTASATEVSALPEEWAGKWVWIQALYQGPDASLSGKDRAAFTLESGRAHNLHPYVYLVPAKAEHAEAAKGAFGTSILKILAAQYDYEGLARANAALRPGDRLHMFGRVLYRKDRDPETSLEVWSFDIHADQEVERWLAQLRKPVTFRFEETPLIEAIQFLALLTNTRIRLSLPKSGEVTLSARATQQPLAFALRDMLKDARLSWIFDDGKEGLKIVQDPNPAELAKVERVVRHLK